MIRINLLPPGQRTHAMPVWVAGLPWKKIGLGVAVWWVLGSLWLAMAQQGQARAAARMRQEWEVLQPEWAQVQERQAVLEALQNRESIRKGMKASESQWAPRLNFLSDVLVSDVWFTALMVSVSPGSESRQFLSEELKGVSMPGLDMLVEQMGEAPAEGEDVPVDWNPRALLAGRALVSGKLEGAPISRFLEKLKEHPEFKRWFTGVEMKDVGQGQVKTEEVSDFVLFLYPTGG